MNFLELKLSSFSQNTYLFLFQARYRMNPLGLHQFEHLIFNMLFNASIFRDAQFRKANIKWEQST